MAHLGVICPDMAGHLNPTMSLSRELQRRGHRVTFYQRLLTQKKIEDAGMGFVPFAQKEFPVEETKAQLATLAALSGRKAFKFTVDIICKRSAACLREVPALAKRDGIDAMLVDQVTPEGAIVAQELGLPYATVCNALILHREDAVPPFFTSWRYSDGFFSRLRNRMFYAVMKRIAKPMTKILNDHRVARGMPRWSEFNEALSPTLQLSQQPREFEYPRRALPASFSFTGPWIDTSAREASDFPYDKLDRPGGRPLIYASMGTLQNRRFDIYQKIAAGCAGLNAQLVIGLGGGSSLKELPKMPGDPLVVEHAPQVELLQRATLCITHAGLNTALESLAAGVPMVAIPVTNDQPGVAARIAWSKTGEMIPLKKLTAARVRAAVQRVLGDPVYRANAQRFKQAIAAVKGIGRAADLIEQRVINSTK